MIATIQPMDRRNERGMTLLEALCVALVVAVVSGIVGSMGADWARREKLRSSLYATYVQVNLARVEAANRNRSCRVVVDTAARTVRVLDLNDPLNVADDEQLSLIRLRDGVEFGAPGGGPGVTLDPLGGNEFQATFLQDGSLGSSTGTVGLQSDAGFWRLSLFAAGGVAVERWNGSSWEAGS